MLKRPPKVLTYAGYKIHTELVSREAIAEMEQKEVEEAPDGLWCPDYIGNQSRIYIVKDLGTIVMWETYWEELGHAYIDLSKHDMRERRG